MKPRTGTDEWNRKQKNCTKIAYAHPRPQFSVDERVVMARGYGFKVNRNRLCSGNNQKVAKAVSEHTGKFTFVDVPVQTLTILDILIVIVHYCLSAQCLLIRKLPLKPSARTLPVFVYSC